MKTANPIEEIVTYLPEVGSPMLREAREIRSMAQAGKTDELDKVRERLMKRVKQNWVESEIETADVMVTRHNNNERNPIQDKKKLMELLKASLDEPLHRYELHDPLVETTFCFQTAAETKTKADELGAMRFQLLQYDGEIKQVDKVNGQWWVRHGPVPPQNSQQPPAQEDRMLESVQEGIDRDGVRVIEERAVLRGRLGEEGNAEIDHLMAKADAYAFRRIENLSWQEIAAVAMANNAREYAKYKSGLDKAIPGYPGTAGKVYALDAAHEEKVIEKENRKSRECAAMTEEGSSYNLLHPRKVGSEVGVSGEEDAVITAAFDLYWMRSTDGIRKDGVYTLDTVREVARNALAVGFSVGAEVRDRAPGRVLVTVSGGVADYVADPGVKVEVFDFDNYRADQRQTDKVPLEFAHLAVPTCAPLADFEGYSLTHAQQGERTGQTRYSGKVVYASEKVTIQDQGRGSAVVHLNERLDRSPGTEKVVTITYDGKQGHVSAKEHGKGQER